MSLSGSAGLAVDPGGAASDIRPAVALRFQVEGRDYGARLKDDTATLRATMGDTVRALLEQNFGFLNWDAGAGTAAETVVVRLYQQPKAPNNACLQLAMRGPVSHSDSTPCPLDFEKFGEILQRADWQPDHLRAEWAAKFQKIFETKRDALVNGSLGVLPLRTAIEISAGALKVKVPVQARDIRAAGGVGNVEFRVHLVIEDTLPPKTLDPDGELLLDHCLLAATSDATGEGYVCTISAVTHAGDVLRGPDRADLLAHVRLTNPALHLSKYRPASVAVGPGGVVTASGSPP